MDNVFTGAGKLLSYRLGKTNTGKDIQNMLENWKPKSDTIKHNLTVKWGKDGETTVKSTS